MNIITDPRCAAYAGPGHPERPARVTRTVELLRQQKRFKVTWKEPLAVRDELLLRAHSQEHLDRLRQPGDFDGDTPAYPDLDTHARRAAGGALQALECALRGEAAFSLMRPPGHHATPDQAMGFCYLSNVAIAVLEARARGIGPVAVLDFDVHHGNGTEAVLLDHPGCAVFSIHQYPAYPGTGYTHRRNSHNYPVPPHTPRAEYRQSAELALKDLRRFAPKLVAVSAGFDAFRGDPLAQQQLEREDFQWWGAQLRALNVPVFSVLEGGYSEELPDLILAYLEAMASPGG